MGSVLLLTDRPSFESTWRDACARVGLSARTEAPAPLGTAPLGEPAVVVDAASSPSFDDLLGRVGLARAHGAVTAVVLDGELDGAQEDLLLELCGGLLARSERDVERTVAALRRRCDPERHARLLYLASAPGSADGGDLLAVLASGKAVLVERPLATEDRGAAVETVRIADHGRSALVQLADGITMELVASELLTPRGTSLSPSVSGYPAALGDVDGVRLGQRLRALRLAAGLTQAELARRTGIHRPNIARVEAGRHTPSLETLARLAAAIGVSTTRVLAD